MVNRQRSIHVLHITPHMGGGVGRVIRNFCDELLSCPICSVEIACLDYANELSIAWSSGTKIPIHSDLAKNREKLCRLIKKADVVHLHWWNHPLVYDLMSDKNLPSCRIVIWSHVNGHNPPNLFNEEVLNYPDFFVMGTPYSLSSPFVKAMQETWHSEKQRTVFASPGYKHVDSVQPAKHDGFNVGYIGTVDYGKMHPDYISMSLNANIPDVKFIVCGGPSQESLRQEVYTLKAEGLFDIRGHVNDISSVLAVLDVFGYPLTAKHYGASEVALIEAQVAGAVPVVLDNGCERHIVEDNVTGIVASTTDEYSRALEYLYKHPEKRKKMSYNARRHARERFSIHNTTEKWLEIYMEVVDKKKSKHLFNKSILGVIGRESKAQLFLTALGDTPEAELFASIFIIEDKNQMKKKVEEIERLLPIFKGKSNGSVFQYHQFFPNDPEISYLCGLVSISNGLADQAMNYFKNSNNKFTLVDV